MVEQRRRQTAYKVLIRELLEGEFVEQEGWNLDFVRVRGLEVSRVNLVGVVVSLSEGPLGSVVLDDGSGQVHVRGFEGGAVMARLDVGQCVVVVGRVRRFGDQRYVTSEIVKPVAVEWLRLRGRELASAAPVQARPSVPVVSKPVVVASPHAAENILTFIRENDRGGGVDVALILEQVTVNNAEQVVDLLLKQGEIFELTPGVVKLLG